MGIDTGKEMERIEMLRSIEREGYKSQHELKQRGTKEIQGLEIPDEPRLAVSRDNELMRWTGGMHRIAAAQVFDVDSIFAFIVVWHLDSDREELVRKYGVGEPAEQESV